MQHQHARGRDATTGSLHRTLSIHTTAIEQTYMAEECDENDYHFDLDSYKPVQPITIDHGVALFPVAAPHTGMDLHLLQVNMQFIRSRYRCRVISLPPLLPFLSPLCASCDSHDKKCSDNKMRSLIQFPITTLVVRFLEIFLFIPVMHNNCFSAFCDLNC